MWLKVSESVIILRTHTSPFEHARFFHHAANTKDARFRRIQDGRKAVNTKHAHVGDGEGAAISSMDSPPLRAREAASRTFSLSGSRLKVSALFTLGTMRPVSRDTAMPRLTCLCRWMSVFPQGAVHDGVAQQGAAHGKGYDVVVGKTVVGILLLRASMLSRRATISVTSVSTKTVFFGQHPEGWPSYCRQ